MRDKIKFKYRIFTVQWHAYEVTLRNILLHLESMALGTRNGVEKLDK